MKIVTEFPRKVVEYPDQGIITRDGCRLSARIWMPEDASSDPVPAILEMQPYRKRDGTPARDCLTHPYFAGHGYAAIRVDMRGNGDSEGLLYDEYTEQELTDACEVIAWAASQSWCNGKVGMMGLCWGGITSLQVAARQPPALKAIIAYSATVDRYADDIHYKGGCLLNENFGWASTMLSYSSRAPDPLICGDKWRKIWLDRLEHQTFLAPLWLSHQRRDSFWKHGSVCEDFSTIKAAVLAMSGWYDGYRNSVSNLVANVKAPVKGIIGPWIHKYPHYAGPEPRLGFLQEALRWWDRWLKDSPTGVEHDPAYRAYVMDSLRPARWHPSRSGRWISEKIWPSPSIVVNRIKLKEPTSDPIQIRSPETCGLSGSEYFPYTSGPELPGDQRVDDAYSICFDQPPQDEAIDIVGAPELIVTVAADKMQANIAVRLCDVHPDGASQLITYGVLALTHHKSHEFPEPLVPGEKYPIRIVLDQTAYRLPAGHRLRVAVSNAYWPMIWPTPEPVCLMLSEANLSLPVRPLAARDEVSFEKPEAAQPWSIEPLRPVTTKRNVDHDQATGTVTLTIFDDNGEVRDLDHGLASGSIAREKWSIHPDDPLTARGETHWTQTLSRGDWSVRTETFSQIWTDREFFHMTARIEGYEAGKLIFEKEFRDKVSRENF